MEKIKVYGAIDIGASGAIALTDGKQIREIIKNDSTDSDMTDFLERVKQEYDIMYMILENVHSMPKQGVSSSFKFGESKGFLRGLVVAHKIRFREVTPQTWMKSFGIKSGDSASKTEHKNKLKDLAQRTYPNIKITLATADAILLAHYCYLQHKDLV